MWRESSPKDLPRTVPVCLVTYSTSSSDPEDTTSLPRAGRVCFSPGLAHEGEIFVLLRAERAGKDPEMEPKKGLQFPNLQQPHFPCSPRLRSPRSRAGAASSRSGSPAVGVCSAAFVTYSQFTPQCKWWFSSASLAQQLHVTPRAPPCWKSQRFLPKQPPVSS